MDIEQTYSLASIARKLGRARTTVAVWSDQFREFLPVVGKGRSMRYKVEAIEIFGLIAKMKDADEPPEYVREQLRKIVKEITVTMDNGDDTPKPFMMNMIESYAELRKEVQELREGIKLLGKHLDQVIHEGIKSELKISTTMINERIDGMNSQVKEQTEQLQEMSTVLTRAKTHKRKSWFRRVFRFS